MTLWREAGPGLMNRTTYIVCKCYTDLPFCVYEQKQCIARTYTTKRPTRRASTCWAVKADDVNARFGAQVIDADIPK